jgi:hypothetical protein
MESTVSREDSSLTTQCLAFCQALASQGKAFSLSLTVGNTFSFSLDNREKTPPTKEKPHPLQERTTSAKAEVRKKKKKPSPSTLRRNAERRKEFLEKEPKAVKPADQAADSAPVPAPGPEKAVVPGQSHVSAGPRGWRSLGPVTACAARVPAPWPEQARAPGLSLVSTPAAAPAQITAQVKRMYPRMNPDRASKITGMLLELDNMELVHMLKDKTLLKSKVEEARHQAAVVNVEI